MEPTWNPEAMPAMGFGMFIVPLLIGLAFYAYFAACLMVIARKTGDDNAWMAWIPFVNLFTMIKAAGKSPVWFILLLIPVLNLVFGLLIWCHIAERRGKPFAAGFLMIVPLANLIVPAWFAAGPPVGAPQTPPQQSQQQQTQQTPPNTCANCGGSLTAGDQFCGHCGAPAGAQPQQPHTPQPAPSGGGGVVMAVGCGVILLLLGGLGVGGYFAWDRIAAQIDQRTNTSTDDAGIVESSPPSAPPVTNNHPNPIDPQIQPSNQRIMSLAPPDPAPEKTDDGDTYRFNLMPDEQDITPEMRKILDRIDAAMKAGREPDEADLEKLANLVMRQKLNGK